MTDGEYRPDDISMAHNNLIALLHLTRVSPVEVLAKGSLQGKEIFKDQGRSMVN